MTRELNIIDLDLIGLRGEVAAMRLSVDSLLADVGSPTVPLDTFEAYFTGLTGGVPFTPQLAQGGNLTSTVNYSEYAEHGKWVIWDFKITCTQTGTANAIISVTLPKTASSAGDMAVGSGFINDGGGKDPFIVILSTTGTAIFVDATQKVNVFMGQTGAVFATALINTQIITGHLVYEQA